MGYHRYAREIDELIKNKPVVDKGASHAKLLYLNLSKLSPYVSFETLEAQYIKVNNAYLISCTNPRDSDVVAAVGVIRDTTQDGQVPQVAEGVESYIAAASLAEQASAENAGDWQVLLNAGYKKLPSGYKPSGLGTRLLEPEEVGISASNRNFEGRMGSTEEEAYLAGPEDNISIEELAEVCMKTYCKNFGSVVSEGVSGFNFGCVSPSEQAAIVKKIPLAVAGSFGISSAGIVSTTRVGVPKLVQPLREIFDNDEDDHGHHGTS